MPRKRDHTEVVELARIACRDLARTPGLRDAADRRIAVTWVELPTDADPDSPTAPALRIGPLALVFVGERVVLVGTGSPSPHPLIDVVALADDRAIRIMTPDHELARLEAADADAAAQFVARFDRLRLTLAHRLAVQQGGIAGLVAAAAHEHDHVGARTVRHAAVLADVLDSGLLALHSYVDLNPLAPSAERHQVPLDWVIAHIELGAAASDQIGVTLSERVLPALTPGTRAPDLPFRAAVIDLLGLLRLVHEWERALVRALPHAAFDRRPVAAPPLAKTMFRSFAAIPARLRTFIAAAGSGEPAPLRLEVEHDLPDWFERWLSGLGSASLRSSE